MFFKGFYSLFCCLDLEERSIKINDKKDVKKFWSFVNVLVVVIDFGMVYLGYVFLFKGFINDFYRIIVYKWSVSLLLCKILINVLFNKDEVLVVFGYEVE